jgi:hypothetical protein
MSTVRKSGETFQCGASRVIGGSGGLSSALCRRLVVVRAGDASLHPQWLDGGEAPTFDFAVCYYGDDPKAFSDCALRYAVKGGKWDGFHAFFAANPNIFEKYDWIWLPDDDIATNTACINRLFDLTEKHTLHLAQPSLTWDSYFSHLITVQNPCFELRWTNFVEIMAPVFRADFLRKIVPTFAGRRFGTGLDFMWARWMAEPWYRTGIIDAVAVRHTRPVGKGSLTLGANDAPKAELDALLGAYSLAKPTSVVYAGLDTHGHLWTRGPRLWAALYRGWIPLRKSNRGHGRRPHSTRRLVKRMSKIALGRLDLTPLPILRHLDLPTAAG